METRTVGQREGISMLVEAIDRHLGTTDEFQTFCAEAYEEWIADRSGNGDI